MKRRNRWFCLFLITFFLLLVSICSVFASSNSSSDKKAWVSQIRPGVMGGNGTTDYFLELFIPVWGNDKTIIFLDPHLRYNKGDYFESFTQDEMEENIGAGARFLLADGKLILGMNAFLDIMQSKEENNYNQFGAGLELLSKWVDFRANYYHPFSTTYNYIETYDRYNFGSTGILLYKGREEALQGFDAELGFLIPGISNYAEARVAAGMYWYFPEEMDRFSGFKGRVDIRPARMINLTYEVKHDDIRGTDQFWGGYLEIPFSFEALAKGENPFAGVKDALNFGKGARNLPERMTEKIIRDRNIVTVKYTGATPVTPAGGDNIIYVNSDFTGTGLGTYEAPYQDIASVDADPRWVSGAVVYVFSTDETADTYTAHFIMKNDTILWGQGYVHPLWHMGGGPNPVLDGAGTGSVVTLAQNNEIMGLAIQNGEHGIYGENILTTHIHDNTVRNHLGATDPSGAVHIVNNFTDAELSGSALNFRINNNQITDNGDYGIYINTAVTSPEGQGLDGLTFNEEFLGNTVSGNNDTGIYNYLNINTPVIANVNVASNLTGNTITGNGGYGAYIYNNLNAALSTAPATGDMVTNISSSPVTNMFSGNTVGTNASDGINATTNITAVSSATANVTGNIMASITESPVANTFLDNVVTDNGANGIYVKTNEFAEAKMQNAACHRQYYGRCD